MNKQRGYMNNSKNRQSYSRWALEEDIKSSLFKVNLKAKKIKFGGIPVFVDSDAVYLEQSDSHFLIFGSTGSKKTRLIGMPSLRLYAKSGESFVATDPKAELYEKTYSTLKKNGYKIIVINLRNPRQSNSWNPLSIPYNLYHGGERDKGIEMVIDMANLITRGASLTEPFWENSAANLLAGLILTIFECADRKEINLKSLRALRTLAFRNQLSDEEFSLHKDFLDKIDKTSFIFSLLSGTTDVCDETKSCIISEFDNAMRSFFCQNDLIDMLSASDFDMAEISKKKTAVFLIIPDENTVYHKLISLFIKQCYSVLISEAQNCPLKKLPRRVNFLLDEFSSLPTITDFPAMITASRSRNIRFNLIIQSFSQLSKRYSFEAEAIKGNCENWIFLYSRENSMIDELVSLAGYKCNGEPLISPTILQTLNKETGEALIFNKRTPPFITNLLDIDSYPDVSVDGDQVIYPKSSQKAETIFDLKEFCKEKNEFYLSQLFTGVTLDEITEKSKKLENEYNDIYMRINDVIIEPIFTSKVPTDDELNSIKDDMRLTKKYCDHLDEHIIGWYGLLLPVLLEIEKYNNENPGKEIQINYVKEKYGSLQIDLSNDSTYLSHFTSRAESESQKTCQLCGVKGRSVQIDNWYWTLCDSHTEAKKMAGSDDKLTSHLYIKNIKKERME